MHIYGHVCNLPIFPVVICVCLCMMCGCLWRVCDVYDVWVNECVYKMYVCDFIRVCVTCVGRACFWRVTCISDLVCVCVWAWLVCDCDYHMSVGVTCVSLEEFVWSEWECVCQLVRTQTHTTNTNHPFPTKYLSFHSFTLTHSNYILTFTPVSVLASSCMMTVVMMVMILMMMSMSAMRPP